VTVASQKARMCQERAVAARQQADSAPSLAEREAGRAIEQKWVRFARLYALMDEILSSVGPIEPDRESVSEGR
jgi:hypothetical protein